MNYGNKNHVVIEILINRRLINKNDIFACYFEEYSSWFLVSRHLDFSKRLWGYRIGQNYNVGHKNIIGILIYFDLLKISNYPTEFMRFHGTTKDWQKFNSTMNSIASFNFVKTALVNKAHQKAILLEKKEIVL